MIDILMAAAITRVQSSRPLELPTLSRTEAWRLAAGLAGLFVLTLMVVTGPDHDVSMGDSGAMAAMSDAAAHQAQVH